MSTWAFWRRSRAGDAGQTPGTWCPFVNQTELVARLCADLAVLRGDPMRDLRKPMERAAVAALDAWICTVLDRLRDRAAGSAELDVTVNEWRRRRTLVGLNPEDSDVLAVAD